MSLLMFFDTNGATSEPIPDGYSRTETGVVWLATDPDGTIWGVDTTTDQWATTVDGYDIDRLGITATATVGIRPSDMTFGGGYMWAHTPGEWGTAYNLPNSVPGGSGRFWRAPIGDHTGWVDVTPPDLPADVCGRNSIMTHNNDGVLLVGQYSYTDQNAYVWRTDDSGISWTKVDLGGTKTRHVHAVHFDPKSTTKAWATIGDSPGSPRGIWRTLDAGLTWEHQAGNEYPIDFVWLPDGLMVGEGDGIERPHITGWREGDTTITAEITPAMAEQATGMADWRGTTRCLALLPDNGIIFYTTTAEGGATGRRYGIWAAARTPDGWAPQLLEETPAAWVVMATPQRTPTGLLAWTQRFTFEAR